MKSGFRILAFLVFFFTISGIAYNQSQPLDFRQQLKMPEVLPASPDAAAIEKFGNIPVSYSTGVPDISIPLWSIKCGNLSWPVSLSYHAGGIRVDEIASSAGLGWSVNGPGVIIRSRAGRADEEINSEPIYTSVNNSNYQYLYSVLNGTDDSEQDIFNFNFNGKSGKFIINQDGSILQIPFSNLKVTYVTGLSSFTITDENGITYLFDQKEMTSSQNVPAESIATYYNSSWYLTKVELPDKKNAIQFSYAYAGNSSEIFTTFSQAVGEKYIPFEEAQGTASLTNANDRSLSKVFVHTDLMKLSAVTFPNGSMTFTYDVTARTDMGTGTNITNKLSAITVNRVVGTFSGQVKKFNLYQSYFYYNPANAPSSPTQYRLRLDSLAESGISSDPSAKKYKFQYNTTPMVPRENYGQDIWGYNNGVWNNPSLLQSQNVTFSNGSYNLSYAIGDANRNVDTNQMKACMLSSITYPTGGKTTFTFEPHVYNTDQTLITTTIQETHVVGTQAAPQVSITTFTLPSSAIVTARVIVDMSMYNFTGVTQPSWVSLKDLSTSVVIYTQTQTNPYQRVSTNQSINLVQGHNYELKAYVYTNVSNSQLTASISVQWDNNTNVPLINKGGGLRIKEIKNYTGNGLLAATESYVYDTAVTLTPFFLIQRTYSDVFYRLGVGSPNPTFYFSSLCRVYSSSPVYAVSTAVGSPMLYKRVQKITTDSTTGTTNGKSEYLYDVFKDENYPVGGRYTMVPLLSNDWQNGFLTSETHYKINNGVYSIVKKTENFYSQYNIAQSYSLRVQNNYIREGNSTGMNAATISADALYYTFPIRSGSKRLVQQIESLYDDNQNKINTYTYNTYMSSKYDFPTRTTVIDSKGNQDSVTYKHSPDFSSPGNVYEKMEQLNIIAPVIEQKFYDNAIFLNTVKNNYRNWSGDGKIIALDSIQASVLSNPIETRLKYYAYDSYNNPLSVSKNKDAPVSYIWGYQSSYPIAEVINSDNNSIAYTSFETDEGGGWSGIATSGYSNNGSATGEKAWTQNNFSISKAGLSTSVTYLVSYWSKSGAYAVNGSAATSLKIANGWTLYEHKVVNPSGGVITITGSGTIDELRLYPLGAQMKTYTYLPLTGISSQCDINGNITYYNYDNLGRLAFLRDENKNVIKRFYYNYSGQPETPNLSGNAVQSGTYMKNCSSGTGSFVTYTVSANTYYAATLADANVLALADITSNGQAYANANGTCTASQTTFTVQSTVSVAYNISFTNTSTHLSTNISLNPNSSQSVTLQVGNYDVSIQPNSYPATVTFMVNGYSSYSTSASFSSIYMSSGSYVTINY